MTSTTTMTTSTDRIEKSVVLPAPRARVWRAISDSREFSRWFGVNLSSPFVVGQATTGNITIPNYDHLIMTVWIETIEPESRFAFRWHPSAIDTTVDYSTEHTTLVTFTLADADGGTRLTVVETGFDALPDARRVPAFTSNNSGWAGQMKAIAKYLAE
jgi:uncharacterized protein YndB with AHSA1/START domain